jgi:hypothetical protein
MHTITIAQVTAVQEKTISCVPVITRLVNGESIPLPEFIEVPLITQQGGASFIHMPIAQGDYCLLLITERCFDAWYNGQDFQPPLEYRMHDYSDGFALVGVNNMAGAITIPDVITMIGDTYQQGNYEHDGDRKQTGNYELIGNITQEGNFDQTGNITTTGSITSGGKIQTDSGFNINGTDGWSGTFETGDERTVTVQNGIITNVG